MEEIAGATIAARKRIRPTRRGAVLSLLGLCVAAALVVAGRWTAPRARTVVTPVPAVPSAAGALSPTAINVPLIPKIATAPAAPHLTPELRANVSNVPLIPKISPSRTHRR